MFTKTFITASIAALAGSAVAVPLTARQTTDTGKFTMISIHSGDANVHLRTINASGERFYIGKQASTYCPNPPVEDCSSYSTETIAGAGNGRLSMGTAVPGGQQAYIAPDGALGFTGAHSGVTPTGAILDGWDYSIATSPGSTGSLTHGTDGIYACPVEGETGVYQIFVATSDAVNTDGCTGIAINTSATEASAWQYD